MARPERHDVDYFQKKKKRGKTLNILQSKYGLEGIGFFTNLMRFLSLTPDHYYCIKDESDKLNFFAEIGITDEEKAINIIKLMVRTAKLDKELWEKHKVIACEAFLNSIEDAYKKRGNKIITIKEIRAIFEQNESSGVSDTVNPAVCELKVENEDDNPAVCGFTDKNEDDNPQRILEDRIVKDTKPDSSGEISEPKKLFLHYWQQTSDVFNILARIESPKEWENYWQTAPPTTEQVKTAMDNFIADVRSGAIEPRYVPRNPDRFVLNGWITTCQKRRKPDKTAPPKDLANRKSLSGLKPII